MLTRGRDVLAAWVTGRCRRRCGSGRWESPKEFMGAGLGWVAWREDWHSAFATRRSPDWMRMGKVISRTMGTGGGVRKCLAVRMQGIAASSRTNSGFHHEACQRVECRRALVNASMEGWRLSGSGSRARRMMRSRAGGVFTMECRRGNAPTGRLPVRVSRKVTASESWSLPGLMSRWTRPAVGKASRRIPGGQAPR